MQVCRRVVGNHLGHWVKISISFDKWVKVKKKTILNKNKEKFSVSHL